MRPRGHIAKMAGASFRYLISFIPFIRNLFDLDSKTPKCLESVTALPKARVAIVGAGIGGCCTAAFLRELGGENLDIHVWQRKGVPVGGRTAVVDFDGHLYESGGSILHNSNKYLVDFASSLGLQTKGNKDEATTPVGIYNGKQFIFQTGTLKIWNTIKTLWHYGLSLVRMDFLVRSNLKKFSTIYKIQAAGQAFETVPDMLTAMGGDDMFKLTQSSAQDYLGKRLGYSERLVGEIVTAALRMNYGQNSRVDAFTTLVALTGMEDGSLWSVVGGNRQIPEKLLQKSNAIFHLGDVQTIERVSNGGKISYYLKTDDEETQQNPPEFDVVIVANPLNLSKVKFLNFPSPIYTSASTTPYQQTVANFVKGEINPSFFNLADYGSDFPLTILTTVLSSSPFEFRSVAIQIPSEVPASKVHEFQKPIQDEPMRVWKVFSPAPLTDEQKQQMFRKIEDQVTVDWQAYPVYEPPEDCPKFVLDDGVFYINGIEKAASAMEMSAIGAKNVALLAREYLLKDGGVN